MILDSDQKEDDWRIEYGRSSTHSDGGNCFPLFLLVQLSRVRGRGRLSGQLGDSWQFDCATPLPMQISTNIFSLDKVQVLARY